MDDPALDVIRLLLEASGSDPDEFKALDLAKMKQEDIIALMRSNLAPEAPAMVQRIVAAHELPDLLAQGWLYRASLPDGKLIVEGRPTPASSPSRPFPAAAPA